jgi:F subunit of K+-transporting ATPase (Potass_KdpF).
MLLITLTFNAIRPESVQSSASSENLAYLAGIIIAVFILGYLVNTLLKPEKF